MAQWGVSALIGFEFVLLALPAQAQRKEAAAVMPASLMHDSISYTTLRSPAATTDSATGSATSELLPLTARTVGIPSEPMSLEQISDAFNMQMESNRYAEMNRGGQLDSLPIIGDLLDESGNLDVGIDLPFDMSISDVMGETGLVFSTDFTVN